MASTARHSSSITAGAPIRKRDLCCLGRRGSGPCNMTGGAAFRMPSPEPLGRGPTALVRGPASARARRRTGFPHAPVVRSLASNSSGRFSRADDGKPFTQLEGQADSPQCMDAHVGSPECQRRRSVHHDPDFPERLHERAYSLVPLIRTRRRSIRAAWSISSNEAPSYYPCRGLAVSGDDYSVAPPVRGQVVARAGRYAQARGPGVAAGVARRQQVASPGDVDRR